MYRFDVHNCLSSLPCWHHHIPNHSQSNLPPWYIDMYSCHDPSCVTYGLLYIEIHMVNYIMLSWSKYMLNTCQTADIIPSFLFFVSVCQFIPNNVDYFPCYITSNCWKSTLQIKHSTSSVPEWLNIISQSKHHKINISCTRPKEWALYLPHNGAKDWLILKNFKNK